MNKTKQKEKVEEAVQVVALEFASLEERDRYFGQMIADLKLDFAYRLAEIQGMKVRSIVVNEEKI